MKASSNGGDVIHDADCGCGTTVAVAQRLSRQLRRYGLTSNHIFYRSFCVN
ncbi:MAG: hypothetical protein ACRCUI_05645 [Polymorphobacter sp.]